MAKNRRVDWPHPFRAEDSPDGYTKALNHNPVLTGDYVASRRLAAVSARPPESKLGKPVPIEVLDEILDPALRRDDDGQLLNSETGRPCYDKYRPQPSSMSLSEYRKRLRRFKANNEG